MSHSSTTSRKGTVGTEPAGTSPEAAKWPSFGYAFYFRARQDYKQGLLRSRAEIELFEYLLVMGEHHLKQGLTRYYHSYSTIREWTGISPNAARPIVARFVALGFITTEKRMKNGSETTHFIIQHMGIVACLRKLYGCAKAKNKAALAEQLHRIKQRQATLIWQFKVHTRLKRQRRL